MVGSLLGNAVRRVEDPDLVRGRGTYVDNLRPDGVLFAAFVRTPFAHATITGIDVTVHLVAQRAGIPTQRAASS